MLRELIIKDSLLKNTDFKINTEDDKKIIIERAPWSHRYFHCSIVIDSTPHVFNHDKITEIQYDKKFEEIKFLNDYANDYGLTHLQHTIALGTNSTVEIYYIGENSLLIVINEKGVK